MSTSITIPRGSPSSRYLTETQTQLPVVISHNKRWLRVLNLLYYLSVVVYSLGCGLLGIYLFQLLLPPEQQTPYPDLLPYLQKAQNVSRLQLIDEIEAYFDRTTQKQVPVIYLRDEYYQPVTFELIQKFLSHDVTDQLPYLENVHDCDDFSFLFFTRFHSAIFWSYNQKNYTSWPVPALGIALGTSREDNYSRHAYNIFYQMPDNPSPDFYCLEPQDDQFHNCVNYLYQTDVIFL